MLNYSFHVVKNAVASAYIDLRYGGALSRDQLHINKHRGPGFNALMHTDWKVLRDIFDKIHIKPDDVLVDVGCGDGRVLNFWLSCGLKNRMVGIEIDEATAAAAAKRYARYPNIRIICADAAISDVAGSIFYVYNSFTGEPLKRFADALAGKPVKIALYNYTDMTPFEGWNVEYLRSMRDELQYRAAIIAPSAKDCLSSPSS
jgi:SAM-dependent methyltransferase